MSWLHGARERLLSRLRRGALDRELAEEIRYHLELETARQMQRGHSPAAARALALARFGNADRIRQATRDERGTQSLEGGMQDVRWAFRSLRTQRGFTALALVTLALGIGAATTAFTVLDTVLLKPLPYRDADRLVFLRERTARGDLRPPSYPNFLDWRNDTRSFSGVVSEQYPVALSVRVGDDPLAVSAAGVSRGFFAVLGVPLVVGRDFTADESRLGGRDAVIVTHEFWITQMGGRRPLGAIQVGGDPIDVVGVLAPGFHLLTDADLFYPNEHGQGTVRSAHNYMVFARLAPGVALPVARAELATLSRALLARYGHATEAVNVEARPLQAFLVGDYRALLVLVLGAALLVLLIACTNLVSAQLARGLSRAREVAVRAALGASRWRLVRQLLAESTLLTVTGAALGAGLAVVFVRVVRLLGTGLVPRLNELTVDGRMLAFTALAAVATATLIGVYPAFRLVWGDAGESLRGTARSVGVAAGARAWALLAGFEIALAVVLTVGSLLLVRTMHNIVTNDAGFDPHGVVTVAFNAGAMKPAEVEAALAALADLPRVRGVALTTGYPLEWGNQSAPVLRPSDPVDHDWPALAGFREVTAAYFSVLRQRLVRGREFAPADGAATVHVAIITPGIANRLWPGEDPLGKLVRTTYLGNDQLTVVGVVAEASSWRLKRGEQNEIYVPLVQHPAAASRLVAMVRTDGSPPALFAAIRARMHALAPGTPVRLGTLDDRIAHSAADQRFAMAALLVFGGIALVLSGIGIYGVMSYSVARRTQEIGVRMALGATPAGVRAHVLRDAAGMAVGGVLLGVAGGLFATRLLQSVLYGVTSADPVAFAGAAVTLFLTALLGAWVPAWRSSRIDPLVAIRRD